MEKEEKTKNDKIIDSIGSSVKSGNLKVAAKKCELLNKNYVSNQDVIKLLGILIENKKYSHILLMLSIILVSIILFSGIVTGIISLIFYVLTSFFSVFVSGTICLIIFIYIIVGFEGKK